MAPEVTHATGKAHFQSENCHDDVRRHCKFYSFDPGSEATWYKSRSCRAKSSFGV